MKLKELQNKLVDECFNDNSYHIGDHWKFKSEVYVLANTYGTWDIFYSENGNDTAPMKSFLEVEDACEYFYKFLNSKKETKSHILTTDENKEIIDNIIYLLNQNGVEAELITIPILLNKNQYKIIVFGKDFIKAKQIIDYL